MDRDGTGYEFGAKLRFFELAHVEEKERRLRLSWNKMISKIIKTGHLQILIQKDFVFRPFQEDKKSFFGQFGGRFFFEPKCGNGEELHVPF